MPLYRYCEEFIREYYGNSAELIAFADSLHSLELSTQTIQSLNHLNETGTKLEEFINHSVQTIVNLTPTRSFYLSGGWINREGNSHAIIYQFKRSEEGLTVSIYNGGDGINQHGCIATKTGDRYYSVKIYTIPLPIDEKKPALTDLLNRLTVPMLPHHPERNNTYYSFNGKKLYNSIDISMTSLKATINTNIPDYLTTQGILTGTCAQASIQQFLKVYLNSDKAYQRFIVQYKLYALNDFIQIFPAPRKEPLNQLIRKFIENTLKIIQDSPFFSIEEKHEKGELLIHHKANLINSSASTIQSMVTHPPNPHILTKPHAVIQKVINKLTKQNELISITQDNYLDVIDLVLHCHTSNSLYLLQQIEQIILYLPLPLSHLSITPKWYRHFDEEQWFALENKLCQLSQYYSNAYQDQQGTIQLPSLFIVQFSFMALLDYVHSQRALFSNSPISADIGFLLKSFLANYRDFPQLSSHDPVMDQRLLHLKRLYPLDFEPVLDADFSLSRGFARLNYYKSILDNIPNLHHRLTKYFDESMFQESSILHNLIKKHALESVYVLFNHTDILEYKKRLNPKWLSTPVTLSLQSMLEQIETMKSTIDVEYERHYSSIKENITGVTHRLDNINWSTTTILNEVNLDHKLLEQSPNLKPGEEPTINMLYEDNADTVVGGFLQRIFSDNHLLEINQVADDCIFHLVYFNQESDRNQSPLVACIVRVLYLMIHFKDEFLQKVDNKIEALFSMNFQALFQLADQITEQVNPILVKINDIKRLFPSMVAEYEVYIETALFFNNRTVGEILNLINLEKSVYQSISLCSHLPSGYCVTNYSITLSSHSLDSIKFDSPLMSIFEHGLYTAENQLINLVNSQYRLPTASPAYLALKHDYPSFNSKLLTVKRRNKRTSDAIQLQASSDLEAALGLLRVIPDLQIQLTLTHFSFKETLRELIDPTVKVFVEATLLDANALLPLLDANPEGLKTQFNHFINQGLTYFTHQSTGQIRIDALFFIQLNVDFYRYAAAFNSAIYGESLIKAYELINFQLETQNNPKIIRMLHQYRFLTSITLHTLKLKDEPKACVESYNKVVQELIPNACVTKDNILRAEYQLERWEEAQSYHPIKMGSQLQPIPNYLKTNALFINLGINQDTLCLVEHEPDQITIQTNPNIVFKRETNGPWIVQKDGYQYYPTTPSLHGFPRTFDDANTQIWQRIENASDIRLERFHTECYVLSDGYFQPMTTNARLGYDSNINLDLVNQLSVFEDLSLITPLAYPDGTYTFDFERYGFSLQLINATFFLKDNPDYKLLPQKASPFADNVACFTFKNTRKELFCMLAVQPFYIDYRREVGVGDFYPMCHDTQMITEKSNKKPYFKSKRYIRYDLDQNQPKPNTTADALYLCYVYLATHEVKKSWALLQTLHNENRFTGHPDECLYIEFILDKLPERIYSEKNHQTSLNTYHEAESVSAENCVCKLKAILLYTRWIQQGNNTPFNDKGNLVGLIANLYINYQTLRRQLPPNLTLSDEESLSILRFINNELSISSSLLYEKARLELQEILSLQQKINLDNSPLNALSNQITKQIKTIQDIPKIETIIKSHPIDLSLPDLSDITWFAKHPLRPNKEPVSRAMQELSSTIGFGQLCKYFPQYYAVAIGNHQKHKYRLEGIAKAILMSYLDDKPKKLLANILYRAIHNTTLFAKLDPANATLDELLDNITPTQLTTTRINRSFTDILETKEALIHELSAVTAEDNLVLLNDRCENMAWYLARVTSEIQAQKSSVFTWFWSTQPTEQAIGLSKFKQTKQEREDSQQQLNATDLTALLTNTQVTLRDAHEIIAMEWGKAFSLANKLPENLPKKHHYQREIAANRHQLIETKAQLLTLYFNQKESTYKHSTALNSVEISELHQQIHQCVTYELQHLWLEQLKKLLETKPRDAHAIIQHLKQGNLTHEPWLMRLQWELKILLRKAQISTLSTLFNSEKITHLIKLLPMGSGKTKAIIPALAYKKADGAHLVIIEAPEALFETNYSDHQKSALKLFNQTTYRFQFDRNHDCSPNTLSNLYQHFMSVMIHKQALMTTGESIQALELKYKEILLAQTVIQNPSNDTINQIDKLGRILRLLRERGIAIIDEVHDGLSPNKYLNHTLGELVSIPAYQLKCCVDLFRFLTCFVLRDAPGIINQLLCHPKSPLHKDLAQLDKKYIPIIANYLRYLPIGNLELWLTLPEAFKQQLSVYQRQLASFQPNEPCLLEQSLSLRYLVNYGCSHKEGLSPLKQSISIPYAHNNTPLENSHFENPLLEINTSIQGLLQAGFNKGLFDEVTKQWKQDILANPERVIRLFDRLKTKYKVIFETIDLDNKAAMDGLFNAIKHDEEIILLTLEHYILPLITTEANTLSSNSYNHSSLYQQVIGTGGTSINAHELDSRFVIDKSLSEGNDVYLQHVLIEQKTPIIAVDFKQVSELLSTQTKPTKLTAIIDISAQFDGIPNQQIAFELANSIRDYNNKIQYILYFDHHNKLSALPVTPPQNPIYIDSSDIQQICNTLGDCAVENLFMYYDQKHTLGTDISLDPNGRALVLTDDTYPNKQGCARMRGLEKEQRVSFVVPNRLKGITLDALQHRIDQHKIKENQQTIVLRTLNKITHVIQDNIMTCLLYADTIETQIQLAQQFQSFLIKQKNTVSLLDEHLANPQEQSTHAFLKDYGAQLVSRWKACCFDAKAKIEETQLNEEITKIIDSNKSLYPDKCYPNTPVNNYSLVTIHENKASTNQLQLQEHTKQQTFVHDRQLQLEKNQRLIPKSKVDYAGIPLKKVIEPAGFSNNLLATKDYLFTYQGQNNPLDRAIKPVQLIYFNVTQESLTAIIVSAEESRELKNQLEHNPNAWLSTLDHTLISGSRPEGMEKNSEYGCLMEQIYFFNGQLETLYEQKEQLTWLNDNFQTKLDVYRACIAPCRKNSMARVELIIDGLHDFFTNQASLVSPVKNVDIIYNKIII